MDGFEEEELGLYDDNDEQEANTKSCTYKAIKIMAKRIKLLQTELRIMSDAQVRM